MAIKAHICKALNRKIFLPIPQLIPGRANRAPKPGEMSASNPRPRLVELGSPFSSKPSPSFPWWSWDPESEVKRPQLSPQRSVHPPTTSEMRLGEATGVSLCPLNSDHLRPDFPWENELPVGSPRESQEICSVEVSKRHCGIFLLHSDTQERPQDVLLSRKPGFIVSMWVCLLEKEISTHSSILAWEILWTERRAWDHRVRHDWATEHQQSGPGQDPSPRPSGISYSEVSGFLWLLLSQPC